VKETKKKVIDIIDIKNCIDSVKKAMQNQDYETAGQLTTINDAAIRVTDRLHR